jgi:Flp pilus assembly protein TadB
MGKLVLLPQPRSVGLGSPTQLRSERARDDDMDDVELWPVAGLLFVASLARVLHALWSHEPFQTEPTVALVFVIGLPWLALRSLRKGRETRRVD